MVFYECLLWGTHKRGVGTSAWRCILAAVLLRCSSSASAPTTNCPSLLREDQPIWRYEKMDVEVELEAEKITCAVGENCGKLFNISTATALKSAAIQVNAQIGDSIIIKHDFDADGKNSTFDIVLAKYGDGSCVSGEMIAALNETEGRVSTQDHLQAGNQVLIVKMTDSSEECALFWKLNVTLSHHECAKNKDSLLCSNTGYCGQRKDATLFMCSCCPGYVGKYCEEKDACYGSPCQHGGFCVDIAEGLVGTTFQCLCPHGYRGRSCEGEVSLCDKKPCQNDGTCHGNQTHYNCLCPRGFTGPDCATNVNECLSNPCIHGVCEDGVGGYKCYCLPGYGGDHCEFEYDECDSSPCINGGACEDLVAGYRCHCGPGYKGPRCQIKVDLCTPNPCPSPAQCVDRGNNYSCICHPGHTSPGCTQHYDPCYPNPCQHGGTCWPSLDSYFCSCLPSYTGDLCEEPMYASQPLPRRLEDPGEPEETDHKDSSADYGSNGNHWHNIYIAGTMLSLVGALVVVGAVICHCRVHKTYLTLSRKLSRSCSEIKQQKIPRQIYAESSWERF